MQRENPGNETGYRSAPAYKLTGAENTMPYHTIIILKPPSTGCFMSCKADFSIIFPFHERTEYANLRKAEFASAFIEQDFLYPVIRTATKSFFKYKLFKQMDNNVNVTSRKQRSFHATQKHKRHFKARIFSLSLIVFHRLDDKI